LFDFFKLISWNHWGSDIKYLIKKNQILKLQFRIKIGGPSLKYLGVKVKKFFETNVKLDGLNETGCKKI